MFGFLARTSRHSLILPAQSDSFGEFVLVLLRTGLIALVSAALVSCSTSNDGENVSASVSAISSVRAELMEACGSKFDAKLTEAIDILASRGFARDEIAGFAYGAEQATGCADFDGNRVNPNPTWTRYLKGIRVADGGSTSSTDAIRYDIQTGERYDYSDPVTVAKKFPSCLKGGKPYERCKPRYHPQMAADYKTATADNGDTFLIGGARGCLLSADYRRFCAMATSMDGCWSYPRGDVIMLPGEKKAPGDGLLSLAQAKRKVSRQQAQTAPEPEPVVVATAQSSTKQEGEKHATAEQSRPKEPKPAKKAAKQTRRPTSKDVTCKDDIGFDTFFQRNG